LVNSYLEKLFSLNGKTAIVTGASRGIGRAIAEGLAGAGASVFGIARSDLAADEAPSGVTYKSWDIAGSGEFSELCRDILGDAGRLDILVNAAGITLPPGAEADAAARFNRTIEVDLVAVFRCCQAAIPRMHGGGSIINVTSINSSLGFPDNPGYVAAKGGLRMMTKALAVDHGADGIRVNNLAPGYVRTDMTQASWADPAARESRARHTVLGRWGEPDDLIGAAIFLASEASAYVTGQDLFIDGGWTAKGLIP
jgi:NAD(P)-dependent dehydrogenase (short-subunit alcohol dehydrogenase family)